MHVIIVSQQTWVDNILQINTMPCKQKQTAGIQYIETVPDVSQWGMIIKTTIFVLEKDNILAAK